MRPKTIVAGAVLTAALALVAAPGIVGSRTISPVRALDEAAFQPLRPDGPGSTDIAVGPADPANRSANAIEAGGVFSEPGSGSAVSAIATVTGLHQPAAALGSVIKPPRYTMSGYASFYDNGTTAMRIPRGTVIRICGSGGCVDRVVNDYGPSARFRPVRVVDMYRPDFFAICGCGGSAGTTWVTVSIY